MDTAATGLAYHTDPSKKAKIWRYAIAVMFTNVNPLRVQPRGICTENLRIVIRNAESGYLVGLPHPCQHDAVCGLPGATCPMHTSFEHQIGWCGHAPYADYLHRALG